MGSSKVSDPPVSFVSFISRSSSAYDYIVPARGRLVAQTDIQIAVPFGCYGRVGS